MKQVLYTLAFIPALCAAAEMRCEVVGVLDGDTIKCFSADKTEEKIRLAGIDAPEKAQPYGAASKKALSDAVFGKPVVIDWHKRDKYGRIIGKVVVFGVDANLQQIERGLAWHYRDYMKEQSAEDRAAYSAAHDQAKAARIGLWEDASPIPPWEFRHK